MNPSDLFFISNRLNRLEKLVEELLEQSNSEGNIFSPYDEETEYGICNQLSQCKLIHEKTHKNIDTMKVIE